VHQPPKNRYLKINEICSDSDDGCALVKKLFEFEKKIEFEFVDSKRD
tara:strand:+ start:198 stop:338 length:141 start_codon:yes stop_codon:yes gene_type:complete